MSGRGAGHSLVGENSSDAPVGGSEHGQEAVPEGSGGVWSQACLCRGQHPAAAPASCPPPRLGGAYVLRSWSRHTRSTSCCVTPVSKIRLCRRKLLPETGGQGWRWHLPVTPAPSQAPHKAPTGPVPLTWPRPCPWLEPHISTPAQSLGPSGLPQWALTLLGVRGHFLHKLNEVFQELGVVIRGVQVLAILSEGGGGQEEWAWGAGQGRGSRLPNRSSWSFSEKPRPPGGARV